MPPASRRSRHSAFVVVDGSFLKGGATEIFGAGGPSGRGYQVESPRIGVLLVGRRWELPIRTMVRSRRGQGASEALGFSIVVLHVGKNILLLAPTGSSNTASTNILLAMNDCKKAQGIPWIQ